ncbi:MAG TPA: ABC transporter permease subunit [Candidatus Limnocylindria bacterium]|nr:ABC transporter permease subunit [Candidatus Limnocylindria bacterium]
MSWRAIFAIVRRDLRLVARARAVVMPLIIVPLIFFVVFPVGAVLAIRSGGEALAELQPLIAMLPADILETLGPPPLERQLLAYLLEYQFASFFLLVPLMVCAVIAADSFAGEKERKTLEALLYTPTSDRELYLAKLLGPWLAAIGVSVFSYVVYLVIVNVLAAADVGRPVALTPLWFLTVLWLGPAVGAMAISILVVVSARVRGFQEAYQLGGAIVLPVVALVVAQLAGALVLDVRLAAVLGTIVWLVAAAILFFASRGFRRERLLRQV